MKKILYIDCFSGISGDMMVGALLDLAFEKLEISFLKNELKKLKIDGFRIETKKEKHGALTATKFNVLVESGQPSRNFKDIRMLIDKSMLDKNVKKISLKMFDEIANAESYVHRKPVDGVHFHEVGAVDSIVDIICTALAINLIGADRIFSRQIPVGKGTADTIHGKIPVPAPATIEILKGLPVYGGDFDFEVTTPTGAAILKVLVDEFCEMPVMRIEYTGNGAGTRIPDKNSNLPNMLRLFLGQAVEKQDRLPSLPVSSQAGTAKRKSQDFGTSEKLLLFSANIDDMSGEFFGYVIDKLFSAKVLDAWMEPIYMKKSRPAYKLCVLSNSEDMDKVLKIIFEETTTLGIRIEEITRISLRREEKKVKLPYGEVTVKTGFLNERALTFSPEYESCAELAKKTGKSLKEVYRDLTFFLSSK